MAETAYEASFHLFLAVTARLNHRLEVVPVLYGSLGLARTLNTPQPVGDVDLLIPALFLADRWPGLLTVMERLQFHLVNAREHEFRRGVESVAFADEESLHPFAGIDLSTLRIVTMEGVQFKELTLTDYLAVYRASERDGYRQVKRGKRDAEKIAQIEAALNQSVGPTNSQATSEDRDR